MMKQLFRRSTLIDNDNNPHLQPKSIPHNREHLGMQGCNRDNDSLLRLSLKGTFHPNLVQQMWMVFTSIVACVWKGPYASFWNNSQTITKSFMLGCSSIPVSRYTWYENWKYRVDLLHYSVSWRYQKYPYFKFIIKLHVCKARLLCEVVIKFNKNKLTN